MLFEKVLSTVLYVRHFERYQDCTEKPGWSVCLYQSVLVCPGILLAGNDDRDPAFPLALFCLK